MRQRTLLLIALLIPIACLSQENTTTKEHLPKRAALYSAVVPSLGQAYNHKWWKMPIVVAGVGGLGYYGYTNYVDFNNAKKACAYKAGSSTYTNAEINMLVANYSESQLQTIRDQYRRSFEISCIAIIAWWALNIVDATVDAYLFDYDINDDISMSIEPCSLQSDFLTYNYAPTGISLKIKF